jgi:uncharacterized membrane protein (UPF0127 family)
MFDFNNKQVVFTKAQLPYLIFAFAPIFLYGVDLSGMFGRSKTTPTVLPVTAQAFVDNKAIKLEVAKTAVTQETGLTHRSSIPIDRGMLYRTTVKNPLTFSGRGMKFATDLVFILGNKVVGTYTNIVPCSDKCINYALDRQYDSVMEVNTGIVERLRIANDTKIDITYATE